MENFKKSYQWSTLDSKFYIHVVNLSQDSPFLKRDDCTKMEIYSGKTLSQANANLSNVYVYVTE